MTLQEWVAQQVAAGARIEAQTDRSATVVFGRHPNHILHFFIGLLTVGLWWLVWIGISLLGGERRVSVFVRDDGTWGVTES